MVRFRPTQLFALSLAGFSVALLIAAEPVPEPSPTAVTQPRSAVAAGFHGRGGALPGPSVPRHDPFLPRKGSSRLNAEIQLAIDEPPSTTKSEPHPVSGFLLLPGAGPGYYHYRGLDMADEDAWGRPETIACIERSAKQWGELYPDRARMGVGDISRPAGGRFRPHRAHKKGLDFDLRPVSTLGEEKVHTNSPYYSREQTRDLIKVLVENCRVRSILFNDRSLRREFRQVKHHRGHHNHLHVALRRAK